MLYKAGEPLTHSVLLFLSSCISPRFYSIDRHQHRFSLSLWLPCWQNQSEQIGHVAPILLLWAFRILNASVRLYIRFIVRCAILFAVIWIIQVAIPVRPTIGVRNVFRYAVLVAFDWMTVDSQDLADIQDLSSSCREVLCRQSWWQRWSFWQFRCSSTIRLKEWRGCFDDLFRVWNLSYSSHLLILRARFLLHST